MPPIPPPKYYNGTPRGFVLPAGSPLYRVHRNRWDATAYSPVLADTHFGGGRFDPMKGDEYPYLYAGLTPRTAVAEVLLRGLERDEQGARLLPRAAVRGRAFSTVETTTDLDLLALTNLAELSAVGQDEWLVHALPDDYGKTRRWAQWLREQAPWAKGLIWPSKRDVGERSVILFGDRCGPVLKPGSAGSAQLDDGGPG